MPKSDEVRWGTSKFFYHYSFSARKTMAIHVHPDLSITVVAPLGTSLETIREKILKRARLIKNTLGEFQHYLPKQPPRSFVSGETHRYLGRQYRLMIRKGEDETIKCQRGYFFITYKKDKSPNKIEERLLTWYRNHAEQIFNRHFIQCMRLVKHYNIPHTSFEIRHMKTRWGSCTKKGRILLNLELIKAPAECIDYVILHELCHLKEHNHGPRFWQLLEQVMPDYKNIKKKLNLYATL